MIIINNGNNDIFVLQAESKLTGSSTESQYTSAEVSNPKTDYIYIVHSIIGSWLTIIVSIKDIFSPNFIFIIIFIIFRPKH